MAAVAAVFTKRGNVAGCVSHASIVSKHLNLS